MRLLWKNIRRYLGGYAIGALLLLMTATMAMVIPYLVRSGVNAISRGDITTVPRIATEIGTLAVAMGICRWLSRSLIFNLGRNIEYDLRNELCTHLLALGPEFYRDLKTGDLTSRVINDLTAIRMLAGIGVLTLINAPLYYLYALTIMFMLSPSLTLATLVPYAILGGAVKKIAHLLMERNLRAQEQLGEIGAKIHESLSGTATLKAYVAEEYDQSLFRRLNEESNRYGLALARIRGLLVPLIRSSSAFSTLIVLTYGVRLVLLGSLTVGDLVAFMNYFAMLAAPTTALGWVLSIFQRGKAAIRRIEVILKLDFCAQF